MEILVVGSGCEKCEKLYEQTLEAVGELRLKADVRRVEDLVEIVKLDVMSVPALLVDGKVLGPAQAASYRRIEQFLRRCCGANGSV